MFKCYIIRKQTLTALQIVFNIKNPYEVFLRVGIPHWFDTICCISFVSVDTSSVSSVIVLFVTGSIPFVITFLASFPQDQKNGFLEVRQS